jgi:hypothetical protein
MNALIEFWTNTVVNKGATMNLVTRQTNWNKGYFVALPSGIVIGLNDSPMQAIKDFSEANKELLMHSNKSLGSWIDKGKLYLDVSELILDKRQAIQLAYSRNQLAIYDNTNQVSIDLPVPQKSGTVTQQKAYLTSVIDRLCK